MNLPIPLLRLAALSGLLALSCLTSLPVRAENITYPADAGVIDVTKPPYNANPADTGDDPAAAAADTAALQAAFNAARGRYLGRTIYLPNGTYNINERLIMTNDAEFHRTMTIQGQSRDGVIIKLVNNAPTFASPTAPKAVLQTWRFATGFNFQNSAFSTNVTNLTIDTGANNPGAVGLVYIANNQSTVESVRIRSGDAAQRGYSGLDMALTRISGPALFKDVIIEGFDYGIRALEGQYGSVFENLTLRNQRVAGIQNGAHVFTIRRLTSENTVPVLSQVNAGSSTIGFTQGVTFLYDSTLKGGASANAALDVVTGSLVARNVTTSGYGRAINDRGTAVPGPFLAEWRTGNTTHSLFPSPGTGLNLAIQETPTVPDDDPATWASVTTARGGIPGAVQGDAVDDTAAIQAAMDSGATTVYFPNTGNANGYRISSTITVGGNVRRIVGLYAPIVTAGALATSGGAVFKFVSGTHPTVQIERLQFGGFYSSSARTKAHFIEQASSRTLVLKNLLLRRGYAYRNTGFGDVFIEDVHHLAQQNDAPIQPSFVFKNQRVWARQINPEHGVPEIVNDGATLWMLGLKSEQGTTLVETKNGGYTEVLGGLTINSQTTPVTAPAFINHESSVSVSHAEFRQNSTRSIFPVIVRETRGGVTKDLLSTDVPSRPAAFDASPSYVLPLYAGYVANAPVPTQDPLPVLRGDCSVTATTTPTATDYRGMTISATTTSPLTYTADQGGGTIHWVFRDPAGTTTARNQTVIVDKPALQALRLTSLGAAQWRVRNPNCYSVAYSWDVYRGTESGSGSVAANADSMFTTTPGPKTVRLFVNGRQVDVKSGQ